MSEEEEEPTLNVYHVISGEELMEMLRRVADGENPDLVYIESYVNAERRP